MGLKLLTLALCSVTGKKVKINSTGKKAKVIATYKDGNVFYQLLFDDGNIENIIWTEDNQGHIASSQNIVEENKTTIV